MADRQKPFDTHIEIITPENIMFHYRVAGPFRRLPAYLVDLVIQLAVITVSLVVIMLVFGTASLAGVGMGVFLIGLFVMTWFYGGLFEALWNGQTPGKRMMQIRVLSVDGQPIRPLQAVLRNILRTVDALPTVYFVLPTYQLGLLSATLNDRFQRLGDLASGTMVVVEEPQHRAGVVRIDDPAVMRLAEQLPPGLNVGRGLAVALSSYVLRRRSFSGGRRLEIARHLGEPLRVQFGLPAETNYDLLLCALYQRTFFGQAAPAQQSRESRAEQSVAVPS